MSVQFTPHLKSKSKQKNQRIVLNFLSFNDNKFLKWNINYIKSRFRMIQKKLIQIQKLQSY